MNASQIGWCSEVSDTQSGPPVLWNSLGAAHLVFGALEVGQHVGRRPAGVAELAPQVEVLVLAADVDHAVDAGRTAEHLAARPEDAATVGAGIGLGFIAPVHRGVGEGLAVAERDVDPAVAVLAAGFQQHDARRRIFGQPRGHDAAGGTRTDHDKIRLEQILRHGHCRSLLQRSRSARRAHLRLGAECRHHLLGEAAQVLA